MRVFCAVCAGFTLLLAFAGCGEGGKPEASSAVRPAKPLPVVSKTQAEYAGVLREIVAARFKAEPSEELVAQILSTSFFQPQDLNGDGAREVLVDLQYGMDDQGNRYFFVLAERKPGYAVIGEMRGDTYRVLKTEPGKYPLIETVWNNTDGSSVRTRYAFDGQFYRQAAATVEPQKRLSSAKRH